MNGPVTIGALRASGKVLEAHCSGCGRFEEMDAATLPFDDAQPAPTAGKKMRCSKCGGRSITTRPQVYAETVAVRRARVEAEQAAGIARRRNERLK